MRKSYFSLTGKNVIRINIINNIYTYNLVAFRVIKQALLAARKRITQWVQHQTNRRREEGIKQKKNENTNKGENEKNRSKRIKRNKPQNLDDITITVHNNNKDHEG